MLCSIYYFFTLVAEADPGFLVEVEPTPPGRGPTMDFAKCSKPYEIEKMLVRIGTRARSANILFVNKHFIGYLFQEMWKVNTLQVPCKRPET